MELLYKLIPNIRIPQSVISSLLELKEKFKYIPGNGGYMGSTKGKLSMSRVNNVRRANIEKKFNESIKLLESKKENIEAISTASKSNEFSESKIHPSLSDACILAQRDKILILTEDYLYLHYNKLETKKEIPHYFSAFSLIRVLYEQNKIKFEDYLAFFSYLSSYRFRFLPFTTEDLEKAVFGDGKIKKIKPENIALFNFQLTLSEEYGVEFKNAFAVIANFTIKVLIDDSILPHIAEQIFAELINNFPSQKSKKALAYTLLRVSVQVINKKNLNLSQSSKVQEKINAVTQSIELNYRDSF